MLQDLDVHRGTKKVFNLTLTDPDGNAIDLTGGQTVTMRVWSEEEPSDQTTYVFTKDATNLADDGTCKITLTSTETDQIPGNYRYELYIVNADTTEYSAGVGWFFIKKRLEDTEPKTFASIKELMETAGVPNDLAMDEGELQAILETAHRTLIMKVGNYMIARTFGHHLEDLLMYYLPLGPCIKVIRVEHNSEEVSTDNYSVDYNKGTVTFNSNETIDNGDTFEFFYIPTVFRDLEILIGLKILSVRTHIFDFENTQYPNVEELEKAIVSMTRDINSTQPISSFVDTGYRGSYRRGRMLGIWR